MNKQIDGTTLAVLNCYRNKYYTDGINAEQGLVANAINEVLPTLVELKNGGYRKASDVAREIFEEFKTEMRSRLHSVDELYKKDPDDFYGGQTWAYSAAIFALENIIEKKYESEGADDE